MNSVSFSDMFTGYSQNLIQLIQSWMIRENKCYTIVKFFSRFWNKTVFFTNFPLSTFESTWSSLYPRFTGYCFNSLRRLLSFSSIEQIILNLMTCPYAIDLLYTLPWHDCAWRCWCVSFGLQYKSVSNLLPIFVYIYIYIYIYIHIVVYIAISWCVVKKTHHIYIYIYIYIHM